MTEPERPNPDLLLAALDKEASKQRRGRLKVFLGMAPGVGKTYAMLEAARREKSAGKDVVIACIETHGRRDTEALTEGLETIPRRDLEYRGVHLTEMDLDAVLARKPQLALVDEFAHTNAPGSRHPKRFHDIFELLEAGIDVFTTLNVQHVESRAEAVRQISGAAVRETIPDTALESAELELVDLPPEELRVRLASGKVYVPESIRAAQENFFRVGNLSALRELALRLSAEHVGQDVIAYRQRHGIADPWKSGQRLLVAVSASPTSASLIRWARRFAGELHATWIAVSVETPRPLHSDDQARLAKNLALARELGAQVLATSDDDVVRGILRVAREQNATQVVVGKPAGWQMLELLRGGSLLNRLIAESGDIDIHAVRAEGGGSWFRKPAGPRLKIENARGYWLALGVVAATTMVNAVLRVWVGYQSLALVYLLAVVFLAMFVGRGPSLVAAALTALAWDFLFVPPLYEFRISGTTDVMMFLTYFVVALAMGHVTARLRAQQAAERRREQRAMALYLLTRELGQATDFADLLAITIREVSKAAEADVALVLPDENQVLTPYFASSWVLPEKEESVAAWAYRRRQAAGLGTETLPSSEGLHLPLLAGDRAVGVLSLRFRDLPVLAPDKKDLLDAYVSQIALALDRQQLRDAQQQAKMVAESERLSRTLLNSISHEMRTPISAITTAAASLADSGDVKDVRQIMIAEIQEAAHRLNRLVANLLSMTRLESGHIQPNLDWCDLGDLIYVTRKELRRELSEHPVSVELEPNLPLARVDFGLMQQAIGNLLLNAAVHTPVGTPVRISAGAEGNEIVLAVVDNGPGLPAGASELVFEKFYRGPAAVAGGSGLGLAIVKGFVEAQGGRINAENRPSGGAAFTIRLPLIVPPPLPAEKS